MAAIVDPGLKVEQLIPREQGFTRRSCPAATFAATGVVSSRM